MKIFIIQKRVEKLRMCVFNVSLDIIIFAIRILTLWAYADSKMNNATWASDHSSSVIHFEKNQFSHVTCLISDCIVIFSQSYILVSQKKFISLVSICL